MKLVDFDDEARFERIEDTTDDGLMPLPGSHPVVIEVYRVVGQEHCYHLARGTKQYRMAKDGGTGPWTALEG